MYTNIKFQLKNTHKTRKDDHEEKDKVNISWKYKKLKQTNNQKLYKSKEGKTITTFYTFCVKLSDERERKKEKKKRKNNKYNEVFKVA